MAGSDGLDLALGAGAAGFEFLQVLAVCTLVVGYRWPGQWH